MRALHMAAVAAAIAIAKGAGAGDSASVHAYVPATPGALNRAVVALAVNPPRVPPRPVVLQLAPGRHELSAPLVLSAAHSGLRFEGAADGATVISGGVEIDPASWVQHSEAGCTGCGAVMRAPLPAGTNYSRQLYVPAHLPFAFAFPFLPSPDPCGTKRGKKAGGGGHRSCTHAHAHAHAQTVCVSANGRTHVTMCAHAAAAAARYVGGVRANWTEALFPLEGAKVTATGYSVSPQLNFTHNGGARIEMVYRGTRASGAQWTESRIPAVGYGGGEFTMAATAFANGNGKPYGQHLNLPELYQNAFELLGHAALGRPGDFYLDLDGGGAGFVYFVTSDGSTPTTTQCAADHGSTEPCCGQSGKPVPPSYQCPAAAPVCAGYVLDQHFGFCRAPGKPAGPIRAVLPQLERLVHGTPGARDLAWANVTFADATWLVPSGDEGFVELQAGATLRGSPPAAGWSDDSLWVPTTGNVLLEGVAGARFDSCTFTRLGACGVSIEGGSQNVTISRGSFTDISGSAVSIGRTNTYNLTDRELHDAGNTVADSTITRVAREFHGAGVKQRHDTKAGAGAGAGTGRFDGFASFPTRTAGVRAGKQTKSNRPPLTFMNANITCRTGVQLSSQAPGIVVFYARGAPLLHACCTRAHTHTHTANNGAQVHLLHTHTHTHTTTTTHTHTHAANNGA